MYSAFYFLHNELLNDFIMANVAIISQNRQPDCNSILIIYDLRHYFIFYKCRKTLFKGMLYKYSVFVWIVCLGVTRYRQKWLHGHLKKLQVTSSRFQGIQVSGFRCRDGFGLWALGFCCIWLAAWSVKLLQLFQCLFDWFVYGWVGIAKNGCMDT